MANVASKSVYYNVRAQIEHKLYAWLLAEQK